nr:E3 ubiquitin-protein ligase CBL-B-like [Pseudochaenichthys georgianus]
MDSADSGSFKADVLAQDAKLTLHAEQLSSINQGMIGLTDRQDEFQSAVTNQVNHLAHLMQQVLSPLKDGSSAPSPAMPGPPSVASDHTTPPGSTLRLAPPERFSGNSGFMKGRRRELEPVHDLRATWGTHLPFDTHGAPVHLPQPRPRNQRPRLHRRNPCSW